MTCLDFASKALSSAERRPDLEHGLDAVSGLDDEFVEKSLGDRLVFERLNRKLGGDIRGWLAADDAWRPVDEPLRVEEDS